MTLWSRVMFNWKAVYMTPFHGPSYTIESQWGKFGTLLPPQGCNFYPILRYGLTEPASLFKCGNFTFLWNPLSSELQGVKYFAMFSLCGFFFAPILPLGKQSYPPIAYKVIAHHSRLGRHVLTLIMALWQKLRESSAPKKSGIWKKRITLMLPCHIWQAPLIRSTL